MPVTVTTTELSPSQYKRRVTLHIVKYVALLLTLAIGGPLVLLFLSRKPWRIIPGGVIVIIFTVAALAMRLWSYVPSRTIEHIELTTLGHATRTPTGRGSDAV